MEIKEYTNEGNVPDLLFNSKIEQLITELKQYRVEICSESHNRNLYKLSPTAGNYIKLFPETIFLIGDNRGIDKTKKKLESRLKVKLMEK